MKLPLIVLLSFLSKAFTQNYVGVFLYILDNFLAEIVDSAGNDTECVQHLRLWKEGIQNGERWAVEMLDATGHPQTGILTGNVLPLGNYDECLDIKAIKNGSYITAQYCRPNFYFTRTVKQCISDKFYENNITTFAHISVKEIEDYIVGQIHICVPASCNEQNMQDIWGHIKERYDIQLEFSFEEEFCDKSEKDYDLPIIHILIIAAAVGAVVVVIMSTFYDIFVFQKRKTKENEYDLFMAFSFYTNGKRLFSVQDKENRITCLHGIRVISMLWIILGHRYLLQACIPNINMAYFVDWVQEDRNMFIIGAPACVDTFLVMSGFLIIYIILTAKEYGLPFNIFVFYIHRFVRLGPALAALIMFYIGILPHLGSGPLWPMAHKFTTANCEENWWKTLLFVQNYADGMSMCVQHSWYLAVDTQMYFFAPFLFLPVQKWPKATLSAIGLLMVASIASNFYETFVGGIYYFSPSITIEYFEKVYVVTHPRAGPWFLGFILGYYMHTTKKDPIDIKKVYVYLAWIVCIGMMIFILYTYQWSNLTNGTPLTASLFYTLPRYGWGLCICWVIFACTRGYGGYINTFLSNSIFNIVARLTYSMYLLHLSVITLDLFQLRTSAYMTDFYVMHHVWGDIVFTTLLSIIWTLVFESPATILENVILSKVFENKVIIDDETGKTIRLDPKKLTKMQ